MTKSIKAVTPRRLRFSIPDDDACAQEWVDKQRSLSLSLRVLIHRAIEDNGMRDLFASEPGELSEKPRRGRPPKQEFDFSVDSEASSEIESIHSSVDKSVRVNPTSEVLSKEERLARMQGLTDK